MKNILSILIIIILAVSAFILFRQEPSTISGQASDALMPIATLININTPVLLSSANIYSANTQLYTEDDLVHFYHQDYTGSTRIITTNSGTKETSFSYLPFGKKNAVSEVLSHNTRQTYSKKEQDKSDNNKEGLYYYGARYYDSATGRFTSVDPIPNNNAYSFVANNPIRYIDPDGRDLRDVGEVAIGFMEGVGETIVEMPNALNQIIQHPEQLANVPERFVQSARESFPRGSLFGFGTSSDPRASGRAGARVALAMLSTTIPSFKASPVSTSGFATAMSTGASAPLIIVSEGTVTLISGQIGTIAVGGSALMQQGTNSGGHESTSEHKMTPEEANLRAKEIRQKLHNVGSKKELRRKLNELGYDLVENARTYDKIVDMKTGETIRRAGTNQPITVATSPKNWASAGAGVAQNIGQYLRYMASQ